MQLTHLTAHMTKILSKVLLALTVLAGFFAAVNSGAFLVTRNQVRYDAAQLPQDSFLKLSQLSDEGHLREAVHQILVPRVVGTEGHTRVREYIVESLSALDWHVDIHKFHDNAPILGKLHFHNIIAKLNPNAERYLILACHYDSKYMPDIEFVGATDSAVPCAMLLNLAHVLAKELRAFRNSTVSPLLLFFDGEEAFDQWGPTDSIYGARHLAKKWDEDGFLDRIDMLMLLDLIGAPDPKFYSFFQKTELWYMKLMNIEDRLARAGVMQRYARSGVAKIDDNRYFQANALRAADVEDDHLPFLKLRVPILHLIPLPFPSVWHTANDNEAIIDYATTENIAHIVRLFTMEYLLSSK